MAKMIKVTLHIRKYDWLVHCYFAVDCYYACEILAKMREIGASRRIQGEAYASMASDKLNGGITYSNYDKRESVLVTQLTSDASEFFNSFIHETGHLATHIATTEGIDLEGEEVRYIQGDISRALYPFCSTLLCPHCRERRTNYRQNTASNYLATTREQLGKNWIYYKSTRKSQGKTGKAWKTKWRSNRHKTQNFNWSDLGRHRPGTLQFFIFGTMREENIGKI